MSSHPAYGFNLDELFVLYADAPSMREAARRFRLHAQRSRAEQTGEPLTGIYFWLPSRVPTSPGHSIVEWEPYPFYGLERHEVARAWKHVLDSLCISWGGDHSELKSTMFPRGIIHRIGRTRHVLLHGDDPFGSRPALSKVMELFQLCDEVPSVIDHGLNIEMNGLNTPDALERRFRTASERF